MGEIIDPEANALLKVGDPAPALAVPVWVKGEAVASFEPGKIYVVEFWATWCGPCRASIPRLTQLQKQYGDKVVILGISIWENAKSLRGDSSYLPRVQRFVEDRGEEMGYRVGFGGEIAKMGETWMKAAGRDGIPSAFIVEGKSGGTGRVVWIGNPLLPDDRFEQNLEAAVNGTLDEAAMKTQADASAKRWLWIRTLRKAENDFRRAKIDGKVDEISAAVDRLVELDAGRARQAVVFKYARLAKDKGYGEADAYAKVITDGVYKDDALVLNGLVWSVVEGTHPPAGVNWAFVQGLAERSDALSNGQNPAAIDTLAKVQFLQGNLDQAIATQQRAVDVAPGDAKAVMQKTLDAYKAAKK